MCLIDKPSPWQNVSIHNLYSTTHNVYLKKPHFNETSLLNEQAKVPEKLGAPYNEKLSHRRRPASNNTIRIQNRLKKNTT
jgi:hypothetical protein